MERIISAGVVGGFYLMLACGGLFGLLAMDEAAKVASGSACGAGQVRGVIWSDGADGKPTSRSGCVTVAGMPVELWADDERGRPAPVRR